MSDEPARTYLEKRFELDSMDMSNTLENTLFWGSYASDRSGNVYFALMEPDSYEITGMRADDTEFLTIEHSTERVADTAEEMVDEEAYILARLEGCNAQWGVSDYRPQPMRPGPRPARSGLGGPPVGTQGNARGPHLRRVRLPDPREAVRHRPAERGL